jgi:hypothetical protein
LSFQRGDVVLLRNPGRRDHADRAALIWRVSGDDVRFLLIAGVRSYDRTQKHRSEMDLPSEDAMALCLPIARPVLFCGQEHRLNTSSLPSVRPIARASERLMARVLVVVTREWAARRLEDRLTFRSPPTDWHLLVSPV